MDCTNKNCPAYAKCLAPYRGSRCKATRATYDLGDPITNADRIRAMTDEELAHVLSHEQDDGCPVRGLRCQSSCKKCWLDWLKQEVSE